jgi:hypothetical protein
MQLKTSRQHQVATVVSIDLFAILAKISVIDWVVSFQEQEVHHLIDKG